MHESRYITILLLGLLTCITACDQQSKQSPVRPPVVSSVETNQVEIVEEPAVPLKATPAPELEGDQIMAGDISDDLEEDFGGSALFEFAKADEAMTAGTEFLHAGEFAKALEQFKVAAEIDTENEEIFFNLGFTHSRLGNEEEAMAAYQKTIEIFPDYGEAHNNLGNLYLKQKLFTKAIEHFKTGIEIDPDHAAAHNNLGTALSRQNKINEAVPHFAKATQINDRYIQAWCNLGNAYTSQKRFEDAIGAFQSALRIDPTFRPALSGMQRLRSKVSALPK